MIGVVDETVVALDVTDKKRSDAFVLIASWSWKCLYCDCVLRKFLVGIAVTVFQKFSDEASDEYLMYLLPLPNTGVCNIVDLNCTGTASCMSNIKCRSIDGSSRSTLDGTFSYKVLAYLA